MFMGETCTRTNEIKPGPRLDVIECAKADGVPGPEMVCEGVLEEVGLKWRARGRCDETDATPHLGPVFLLHFRGQEC